MPEVFVDTCGWASGLVRTEPSYARAAALLQQWQQDGTVVVTTNYVIAELVALLTSPIRLPRNRQVAIVDSLKAVSWIEMAHMDSLLDDEAWALLKQRQDKLWSLVDCTSFVVMRRRGIIHALTTDQHFEQAGFVRLLK